MSQPTDPSALPLTAVQLPGLTDLVMWSDQSGGAASIWTGLWHGTPAVAKVAAPHQADALRHEWRTLLGLPHPRLPAPLAFAAPLGPRPAVLLLARLPGSTWRQCLPKVSQQDAAAAMLGALQGLAALHGQGLCHGDVHAGNLLWADGAVHLLDLGLSAPVGAVVAGPGQPAVASPQRLAGEPVAADDDLFALAATFWTLRTHQSPWPDYPALQLAPHQRPLPPDPARLPPALASVLAVWLAPERHLRPPDARQALRAWEAGMTQCGLLLPPDELQAPIVHLQDASKRPLRLDACAELALPSRGVLAVEPGDGATAWLLQLASLHGGVCGWLQQTPTGLAVWPLADEWTMPRPGGVLVDVAGAQEAACLTQVQRWLAALGPDPLLLVDDADQLPVAMQRALRRGLEQGWPMAMTRLPGAAATAMPPLQVQEAGHFLHLASGWQWSGDLVHVLLDNRPTRRALWQQALWLLQRGLCSTLADMVVAEVGLDPATLLWRHAGEPAPAEPGLPHDALAWSTYLDRQLARGFGDRAEAAVRAWMAAHPPPVDRASAGLVTAWLLARAHLALPPVSGTEAEVLAKWLDQPWDPARGVAEAELVFRAGHYDAAAKCAQRVVDAATSAASPQTVQQGLLWLAFAHTWRGDGLAAKDALAALSQIADLPAEMNDATQYLTALLAYYAGQLQTAEAGFAALQALGEHPLAAAAASGLGLVAHRRGDLAQARSWYQVARNQAWQQGDRLRALNMAMNLAVLDHESGALPDALQHYDAALQQAEALGNRGAWLRARLNQCNLLTLLGCDEEARLAITAALAELDRHGVALLCWNAHQLLAEIARRQGAVQVAATELALAHTALEGVEARTERLEWRLEHGWQQLAGDVAAAQQTASELIAQTGDYPEWQARAEHLALTAELAAAEWSLPTQWRSPLRRAEAALARAPVAKPMIRLAIALDVVRLSVLAGDLPRAPCGGR
jgi:tetratricopeptide (TPR) repeat protein